MNFLIPPRRRSRSKPRLGSRFRRIERPREELAGKLVQGIVMIVLAGALLMLLLTSIRMLRAHFLVKYGSQAWLLPIIIGLILLFILYRLFRLWAEIIGRMRESRDRRKS